MVVVYHVCFFLGHSASAIEIVTIPYICCSHNLGDSFYLLGINYLFRLFFKGFLKNFFNVYFSLRERETA